MNNSHIAHDIQRIPRHQFGNLFVELSPRWAEPELQRLFAAWVDASERAYLCWQDAWNHWIGARTPDERVRLDKYIRCAACRGTGKAGTSQDTCRRCHGRATMSVVGKARGARGPDKKVPFELCVYCPTCGSDIGIPCRTRSSHTPTYAPHVARHNLAHGIPQRL